MRINGRGFGRLNFDDREIGLGIPSDLTSDVSAPVPQGYLNAAHAFNHVMIGHDVATRVDDDARAHSVDLPGFFRAGILRRDRFWSVDVDNGRTGPLDCLDDGCTPSWRRIGRYNAGDHDAYKDGSSRHLAQGPSRSVGI